MTADSTQPAVTLDPPAPDFSIEALTAIERDGLGGRMGTEWLEATPDRVVARIPVQGNTQPFGLLHGGASAVLAESTGSVLCNLHAGPGRIAVGVELSCSHHRSARDGWVTAVATPISIGRTLATTDIVITDDQDRRICTARLTCYLRSVGR